MKFTNAKDLINFIEHEKRLSKKVDLRNMEKYCEIFQHPERSFPSIHITGTNGKGSIVAYLNEIFRAANLKVGCFTSPYITCFNERIRYQDENIANEELLEIGNLILEKYPYFETIKLERPTFFEFITLIAFIYFSRRNLDLVLLEVGMGGRLDATNVVKPLISVITGISTDHREILGDSEVAILGEKLGIVKDKTPLFVNLEKPLLKNQAKEYAKKHQAEVYFLNKSDILINKCDLTGSIFSYQEFKNLELSMLGYHQIENASLAIEVAKYYFHNFKKQDFDDLAVLLNKGLKKTKWLGRLEIINDNPFLIVDGAHNVGGISRICEFIDSLEAIPFKRAVVAISANKDKKPMIELLEATFDELVFTEFHYQRSSKATNLFELCKKQNKRLFVDYQEMFEYLKNEPRPMTIFIGSLYFISEIRQILKDKIIIKETAN